MAEQLLVAARIAVVCQTAANAAALWLGGKDGLAVDSVARAAHAAVSVLEELNGKPGANVQYEICVLAERLGKLAGRKGGLM